jgi:hypothetical protein
MLLPMQCLNGMRRLTFLISIALALIAVCIPATAGAKKSHHKRHHAARVADRNHNGMPDRWERHFRVHKATADPDRDGVANIGEFHNGTNPRDADTDNDGVNDGDDDANHDGIDDADEQSGTIASFDGTKLTVTLVNGDTLTGTVTDATRIECDNPSTTPPATATTRHDGGDDNESGDDHQGSGSGTTTSGSGSDDQGDQNEQGDDRGGDDQGEDDQGDDDANEHAGCTKDALTPGTIVREAELHLTSAGAIFDKIELGGKAPA